MSDSLRAHGLQHTRLPCPWPTPRVCSNSCPLSHPTVSSSAIPFFSCPQSFPASWSFLMDWLFVSGGQRIGASASVLLMNSQGWFPLGLTGLICLLSRALSRVLFSTTVWKHQFFCAQVFFTDWLSHPHLRLIEKSMRTCILKSKMNFFERNWLIINEQPQGGIFSLA